MKGMMFSVFFRDHQFDSTGKVIPAQEIPLPSPFHKGGSARRLSLAPSFIKRGEGRFAFLCSRDARPCQGMEDCENHMKGSSLLEPHFSE
jgi:hypothetical protein